MHPLARNTLAVSAGIAVAVASVAGIEAVGHAVYPVPAGLDFSKPEQMQKYIHSLPLGALMFVLAAWVVAAFAGGLMACFIAQARPMLVAGIVGAFVVAATAANLLMIPHPTWFAVVGILGIIAAALIAGQLASSRLKRSL